MFQTFTGSSRRPRQVNLSGRNPNPFATYGQNPNPLATAQQDRQARRQERERTLAATSLQKSWRGYISRKHTKSETRVQWDKNEAGSASSSNDREEVVPYKDEETAYSQLTLLLTFLNFNQDMPRLERLFRRLIRSTRDARMAYSDGPWPKAYLRLQTRCLHGLDQVQNEAACNQLLDRIRFLSDRAPEETTRNAANYYKALRRYSQKSSKPLPIDLLVTPLKPISATTLEAYLEFANHVLTIPDVRSVVGGAESLNAMAGNINCKILASAVSQLVRLSSTSSSGTVNPEETRPNQDKGQVWLLAHIIYFHRCTYGFENPEAYASQADFVFAVATLLSRLADRVDFEAKANSDRRDGSSGSAGDSFLSEQIGSLVNQASIGGLVSQMKISEAFRQDSTEVTDSSRLMAGYILTLLRLFPRRSDEIRMWLYLGSSNKSSLFSLQADSHKVSVVQYFWRASRHTPIFSEISKDPRVAIKLLRPRSLYHSPVGPAEDTVDDQWRIILIFVELYLFILKVMDDEEFFASNASPLYSSDTVSRHNGLQLDAVQELTTFLKHLGFAMYYYASDIMNSRELDKHRDLASLFRAGMEEAQADSKAQSKHIAGLQGLSLDYMKGIVTGLLRAIYERDSRRPFLPRGHWLLTSFFDMTNFIDAVVEEEERRNQIQDDEDQDEPIENDEFEDSIPTVGIVGTGHASRQQRIEQRRRKQRKESRRMYLQAVAPRLEILQNMPFLIPFTTRVKIFRRFVHLDQVKRRNGIVDPEMWRMSQMQFDPQPLARHHAKIRREHEFEDAFEQFFDLGPSLKEPIHITFVDQFDRPEAGIDGGGVTKEFLTSVTSQAFGPREGIKLCTENEKHLLYPNPSAVEEQMEILKEMGYKEDNATFCRQLSDFLQHYEFLGRILGKCLYEGILVDIRFAGFFLLKWALTGGAGSAPNESGYRANLNDLRDFDEGLYQGLIKLKNYPGDVESFSLNFTVTDTITIPSSNPTSPPRTKIITRPLKPNGAATPVTNANRLVYISYMSRHRLSSQPYLQTAAFLRGLAALVPPSWLSMFNQTELQTLVGGAPAPIDVADLRRNTVYGGLYTIGDDGLEHPSVRIFWDVMTELEDAERRKVLKFVTSTPRAPLLGFGSLTPRFSVRDSGTDETRLPSTSTCVNLLKLPRYSDRGVCRVKLLQAVNAGAGFDLS